MTKVVNGFTLRPLDRSIIDDILAQERELKPISERTDSEYMLIMGKPERISVYASNAWSYDYRVRLEANREAWADLPKSDKDREPLPLEMLVAHARASMLYPEVAIAFEDGRELRANPDFADAEQNGFYHFEQKYGEDWGVEDFRLHIRRYQAYRDYFATKYCLRAKRDPLASVYQASVQVGSIDQLGDDKFLEAAIALTPNAQTKFI